MDAKIKGDINECEDKPETLENSQRKRKEPNTPLDWDTVADGLAKVSGDQKGAHEVVRFLKQNEEEEEISTKRTKIQEGPTSSQTNETARNEQGFVSIQSSNDKDKRREVHDWVRNELSFCALTDTAVDGEVKIIRVWHKRYATKMPSYQNDDRNRRKRVTGPKPPAGMKYIRFVLYKENMDTGYAIHQLQRTGNFRKGKSSRDGRSQSNRLRVGFAGNKDKRGITSQFITVPAHTALGTLCSWNSRGTSGVGGGHTASAGASFLRVGNFCFVADDLRLGSLTGNRFDVVMRNVKLGGETAVSPKDQLFTAVEAIRTNGFINYFGVQRFGKFHDTHITGMAVLKGDFKRAVETIMEPKQGERDDIVTGRETWMNRFKDVSDERADRAKAESIVATKLVGIFGRSMTSELAILQHLAKIPLDYEGAFRCVTKTLRMMFAHAVQSFIWNHTVSKLVSRRRQGLEAAKGDLILDEEGGEDGIQCVRV